MNNGLTKIDKDILEIRFQNEEAYLLKKLLLSSAELEAQLSAMTCTGNRRERSRYMEDARLPPFIVSFYELVFSRNCLPSEEEFIGHYRGKHVRKNGQGESFIHWGGKSYRLHGHEEALKGRMLRSYPSLVRDLHFYLKCCESPFFEDVQYSLLKDYTDGIDVQVGHHGQRYCLSLYTNTRRGRLYKERKYRRHSYDGIREIRLGIDPRREGIKISNFYLYGKEVLDKVIKAIEDDEQ